MPSYNPSYAQMSQRYRKRHPYLYGAAVGAGKLWGRYGSYGAPAAVGAAAMAVPYLKNGGGLSGQGFKGGAAPIPGRSADAPSRRRKKFQKAKKCRNMKGMALKKEVCKLSNQIKELKSSESASLGKMTYRKNFPYRVLCNDNKTGVLNIPLNRTTEYEETLALLKYYDPATPGTLITAAAATGTYQKNFLVKDIYSKLVLRNNYQTDVSITVYLCKVKADSSISPYTAWEDGITTDAGNVTSKFSPNQYPTDYDVFNDLWSTKRVIHKTLSPGESTTASHTISDVEYNPALVDEHSATYQSRFRCAEWLVVVRGMPSHDTALDQQGLSAAGVDIVKYNTWKVSYDAGVNLSFIMESDNLDTPTNGFVQSHQPTPDNIAYSVA